MALVPHLAHQPPQQLPNGTDNLVCDGTVNSNSGCAVIEWSRASYGEYFESQGGGVFATKWDENEIATCTHELIEPTPETVVSCSRATQGRSTALLFRRTFSLARRTHQGGVHQPQNWCQTTATRSATSSLTCPSSLVGPFAPLTIKIVQLIFCFRHDILR